MGYGDFVKDIKGDTSKIYQESLTKLWKFDAPVIT